MNHSIMKKVLDESLLDGEWTWKYDTKFIEYVIPSEWETSVFEWEDGFIMNFETIWICRKHLMFRNGRGIQTYIEYSKIKSVDIRGE